jgi:hypothetical protein
MVIVCCWSAADHSSCSLLILRGHAETQLMARLRTIVMPTTRKVISFDIPRSEGTR